MVLPALALAALLSTATPEQDEHSIDFGRDVRPILSDRCFPCHGPDEKDRKGHLRLDQSHGKEGAYRTYKGRTAIRPKDLTGSEVWLRITTTNEDERMPPVDAHPRPLKPEEILLLKEWILAGAPYERFWAFVPPKPAPPGRAVDPTWSRGVIDPLVAASLNRKQLTPRGAADKRTLIRRVSFDLTGLPPTLKEIREFLADDTPRAYPALVDRLLARKSYGEHMTRYWADLVRLADSSGMHKDFFRDFSPYRDWLIRSFNDNLSFDKFITYQLAGDLYKKPTPDQLVASGFNRLHLIIDRGTALPEESLHKNILDRVEAFGTVFLGLTVKCAQCHDHKYDPITQREYYQLYAFFNSFDGEPETRGGPEAGIQPPFIQLPSPGRDERKARGRAMVMREKAAPTPTRSLEGGAYDAPGDKVERNTPAFLPPMKAKEGPYSRMDLAEWLIDPRHPLTARVAVNRFWQQFFGVGLVKTSEDFGSQGESPRQPELLDALALFFRDSGWNVKRLVREIVLSRTYRQSSDAAPEAYVADPENRNLARGSRFRLDAEMIRDQILFLSGNLNTRMYGQSVKPPQPPGLWKSVSMAAPLTYVPDTGDAIHRRSLYTFWKRSMPPPQMTILNAPSREYCVARRERTNTSLQALLLMNEKEYFKAAKACARRVLLETEGDKEKGLRLLYEKVTSQVPDAKRLRRMVDTLEAFRTLYTDDPKLAEALTPEMEAAGAARRAEMAAWSMMAHSLFNLELTKVRR